MIAPRFFQTKGGLSDPTRPRAVWHVGGSGCAPRPARYQTTPPQQKSGCAPKSDEGSPTKPSLENLIQVLRVFFPMDLITWESSEATLVKPAPSRPPA